MRLLIFIISIVFFSCSENKPTVPISNKVESISAIKPDTIRSVFSLSGPKDTVVNGEEIKHYGNGKISMRGMRKDAQREGVWKSWYDDGTPWSETTFLHDKKNGKTITWYENGNKRYEGFYTNDDESGKWTYWDEKGNLLEIKDYGEK